MEEGAALPCGCLRGGIVCAQASKLTHEISDAFTRAVNTGKWRQFEALRDKLEEHYEKYERVLEARVG